MKKKRCRHERNSWIIAGGFYEWCYCCGALRRLSGAEEGNLLRAASTWVKPTGAKGKNPFTIWRT